MRPTWVRGPHPHRVIRGRVGAHACWQDDRRTRSWSAGITWWVLAMQEASDRMVGESFRWPRQSRWRGEHPDSTSANRADRSTKDVARANLAAHIDSIRSPAPARPPTGRGLARSDVPRGARVGVSHTSRGRTSSRLHLATCSRARSRALVVAQPSDAGGCASPFPFVESTGSYSRANIAWASRSRSMKGSPLTSTATRLIVPPVKRRGASPG